ncbi:MAG: CPBP family intramembrane metalloprotease [Sulfuritalea sp.]|nr:CPBP family intramembrane metalloprotease [Sulfuritalea sp.]
MFYRLGVEFLAIYILPVVLILFGVLPFEYRFVYLVTICSGTIFLANAKNYSIESLGMSVKNIRLGIKYNLYLSLVFLIFFLICWQLGMIGREFIPQHIGFYLFYVFISCPLQEFTYRSYLFRLLDDFGVRKSIWRVLFNSFAFCFLHAIYEDSLTLVFTFAIGVVWASIYQRTRSVYGVCLSHIVFGTISIAAGLV